MAITLQGIEKKFPTKASAAWTPVLDHVDLAVPDGRIVALFGPNGCGKTTILSIISGIEAPDAGTVSVTANGSERPKVGFAFQNFRDVLLPWQSALDNVAFGLCARGLPRAEARQRAISFLDEQGFAIPRGNYAYQLSVGQQQLVALARVLLPNPANVLLDEPFSALDHDARLRMRDVTISTLGKAGAAIVFVSHDVDEALYVSDELYLLSKRPARILRRFAVPFQRPRHYDLLTTAEFADLRRQIIGAFLAEVAT